MQKRKTDVRLLCCMIVYVVVFSVFADTPVQSAQSNGFTSKLDYYLLGKVRLYVTHDKAKIVVESAGTIYVGDADGKVVIYSDRTKRRHDSTAKDFFPPGQKTQLMVTGLDLRTVPFDLSKKVASQSGKLKTASYPVSEIYLRKEIREMQETGFRRYRVKRGQYQLYEKMPVSKNVLAFIQRFFSLPPSPGAIPVELHYYDWKDLKRDWINTRENRLEPLPDKVFALPNYPKVPSVHRVTADAEDDQSTSEYFDALGKFIHK